MDVLDREIALKIVDLGLLIIKRRDNTKTGKVKWNKFIKKFFKCMYYFPINELDH